MSPCEQCQQHRRRWRQHAGPLERAWVILSPFIMIGFCVLDRVCH